MRSEQLKLAISEDVDRRRRREARREFQRELDEQLEVALARIEKALNGFDVHKWLADELTDDEQHPVNVTQVYDWLSRRNGRRPPAELIAIVYEHDELFAAWWNTKHSYTAPQKIVRLPWNEERALYRRMLLEFGSAGEQKLRAIDNAKPEPKRDSPEWERTTPVAVRSAP